MADHIDADHVLGLELQLEELVEQRRRAEVQHRDDDARALQTQIDALTDELVGTAERIADEGPAAAGAGLHSPEIVDIP